MATITLIHGAWGGAHGFRHVRAILRAQGHDVSTPSLTGIGERVHLASPLVDLNLAIVNYAADPERNLVIAMGVVDDLGKGAAGQAGQNANLMCDLPETAGLEGAPVWP